MDRIKSFLFEYQTPKVVIVKNVPFGIMRFIIKILVIVFVIGYKLWYSRGYQRFENADTSLTIKVKGLAM